MIKSLFILNPSGNVVLEKHWRGATPRAAVEVFWVEVCKHARKKDVPPVITTPKHYMVSIQRSGLFFLAIVIDEVPPLLVIELLDRMCRVFKIYFSSLSESVLISNFTTVYMLLEEMLDDGFPMTTEANALMDMIRPPSMFDRIAKAVSAKSSVNAKLGSGVTSQTPWRRSGVKYAQNEIYFDVTESIDCIVAANGQVVSCTVSGVINANCRLSGMPDLTMSFEKSSIMEDVSFHPCVRYSRWERDHVVSFVPPDGDFELMRYTVANLPLTSNIAPLYCKPSVRMGDDASVSGTLEVVVGTKPGFSLHSSNSSKLSVENVVVEMYFPPSMRPEGVSTTTGDAVEDAEKALVWTVGRLGGGTVAMPTLSGRIASQASAAVTTDERMTAIVKFTVPNSSVSGIKIDNLNLQRERYKPYKGVRCTTKAGCFQVRT